MSIPVNIDSQIVVKTAAQWAVDSTIYSAKRLAVTSDVLYPGTDQRKIKIFNGVDTWANLDYLPIGPGIAQGLPANLAVDNTTGANDIIVSDGQIISSLSGKQNIDFDSDSSVGLSSEGAPGQKTFQKILPTGYSWQDPNTNDIGIFAGSETPSTTEYIQLVAGLLKLVFANVEFTNETASKITTLDASKRLKALYDFSIDGTLAANSDSVIPSQKAIKSYADNLLALNDALVFKGVIDASTNPNYPAGDKGHTYKISVAGKIGGASGPNVEIGDTIYCIVDGSAAGTQAAVGANWVIVQTNIDGAVIGPSAATDGNFALWDGTTGKLIKNSAFNTSSFQLSDATLAALAGLTIALDSLSIGTGADAFTQVTFGANTFPAKASTGNLVAKTISDFILTLMDDTTAAAALATLGAKANAGVTDGSSAAAGIVGEEITGSLTRLSGVSLTTTTAATVFSFSLTAGDWDVAAMVGFLFGTGTSVTVLDAAISLTNNTLPAAATTANPTSGEVRTRIMSGTVGIVMTTAGDIVIPITAYRISVAATTTFYLVARANFTVSTTVAYGSVHARRVR